MKCQDGCGRAVNRPAVICVICARRKGQGATWALDVPLTEDELVALPVGSEVDTDGARWDKVDSGGLGGDCWDDKNSCASAISWDLAKADPVLVSFGPSPAQPETQREPAPVAKAKPVTREVTLRFKLDESGSLAASAKGIAFGYVTHVSGAPLAESKGLRDALSRAVGDLIADMDREARGAQ